MSTSTYAAQAAAYPAARGETRVRTGRRLASGARETSRRGASSAREGNGLAGPARWYVARVHEGREEAAARDLRSLVDEELLHDCFVPKVQLLQKRQGQWVTVERLLYPGYVFAVSGSPRGLDRRLGSLSFPVHLIGRQRTAYVPLTEGEQAWFESVLDSRRTLRPSTGVIERDQVRVAEGPLSGFEARIRKVNRHKALALVEVSMPDRPVLLRAALAITSRT
ncbi:MULTISPECIES: transcription termination/antitermination NusG family protein [unclassified Adlercreutzia]|uniref:transcription termination/antitermination NusG family protein n=1 Tax=unclassified Adlercreutzia TaxID=2636013 RepID=UPI0013ED505B|nr:MULTISPECIES: transcription termination/antitermination NusG family protein [unclassified Adlercreutzia]